LDRRRPAQVQWHSTGAPALSPTVFSPVRTTKGTLVAGFTLTDSFALAETATPVQDRPGLPIGDSDSRRATTWEVSRSAAAWLKATK